jgi:hypothetical protein
VSFIASDSQFTPKTVETEDERKKLMFRVNLRIDPQDLKRYYGRVEGGLRGAGFVLTSREAKWPAELQVKLPPAPTVPPVAEARASAATPAPATQPPAPVAQAPTPELAPAPATEAPGPIAQALAYRQPDDKFAQAAIVESHRIRLPSATCQIDRASSDSGALGICNVKRPSGYVLPATEPSRMQTAADVTESGKHDLQA